MLANLYVEALLADEDLADQVWEAWAAGELRDSVAAWAWWMTAFHPKAAVGMVEF